ncbi:MAG: DUF4129 domain-containing protein [Omnitrophica WOR_2 bacterium]
MSQRQKRLVFIFSILGMAAMLFLAAGLSDIELKPGQQFPSLGDLQGAVSQYGAPFGQFVLSLMRLVYLLGLILLPVMILYLLFSKEARKRLLKELLRMLPFMLFFLLVSWVISNMMRRGRDLPSLNIAPPGNLSGYPAPTATFTPNTPQWLVLSASFLLALILVVLVGSIVWMIIRRRAGAESPVLRLRREAEDTLDALQRGEDFKNSIFRCYYEMNRVVSEQRGIQRNQSVTPSEFIKTLTGYGLPKDPVIQLTRLFEEVRYGNNIPDKREELMAVDYLSAIVKACQRSI